MNILSEDFLQKLRIAIVEIVKDALLTVNRNSIDVRYLKKIEARQYVGGINHKGFETLIAHGLKEVRIDGMVRYDKQDIDELMAKFKI